MGFAEDWNLPGREPAVAADIEIARRISKILDGSVSWTVDGTWTNTYRIACNIVFAYVRCDVSRVIVDGKEYDGKTGLDLVNANQKTWLHDAANGVLWIRPKSGTNLDLAVVIVYFTIARGTHTLHMEGNHYLDHLLPSSAFETTIAVSSPFGGFAAPSDAGQLILENQAAPYYGYDGELQTYDWHGTAAMRCGINSPYGAAGATEYVPVRKVDLLKGERTDSRLTLELAAKIRKAKVKVAQQLYDHEDPDADAETYHDEVGYPNMDRSHEGKMQRMKFGTDDSSGTTQKKWEEATECVLVDQGTNGKLTKWKVAGRYKNAFTEEVHGQTITGVLHRRGNVLTPLPSSYYTISGESGTLIAITGGYVINVNTDQVRATTSGLKDVSGRFTGSGSSVIQSWHDAIQAEAEALLGYRPSELDIASMTAAGVSKTIGGVNYNGTIVTSDAWYGNILYSIADKDSFGDDHLDVFAKSGRACVTEGNDGRMTVIQISATPANTDVFFNGDLCLDWKEIPFDERVFSRIVVEYSQRANDSKPRWVASRKHQTGADGTANVRNNFGLSLLGLRADEVIKTAIKSKSNAKALANVWRDIWRLGGQFVEFIEPTGALIQVLPFQRIVGRRTRAAGGSINEKVYWPLRVERTYFYGAVRVLAMEATA